MSAKKKPVEMKVIQGKFRKDRYNKNAPVVVKEGPKAPVWLTRNAVEHFGVLKTFIEPRRFWLNSGFHRKAEHQSRLPSVNTKTMTTTRIRK